MWVLTSFNAAFILGQTGDTDSILAATNVGDSSVVSAVTRSSFATTNPTGRLLKGEDLIMTVDYDGSSGTAAANLTVTIAVTEG